MYHKMHKILLFVLFLPIFLSCGHAGPRSYQDDNQERKDGWIGVYVQDIDDEMREYLNLDIRRGALVNDVAEDSPAERAGLEKEDVITKYDNRTIRNTRDLTRAVKRSRPGEKIRLEIIREADEKRLTLRVEAAPERYARSFGEFRHPVRPRQPRIYNYRSGGVWLGVQMVELNADLADYFEARQGDGILVVSVVQDSPADKGGLKAGDIIIKIDGSRVSKTEDIYETLTNYKAGDEIEIEIIRKGKQKKIPVKLARAHRNPGFHFNNRDLNEWKEGLREWKHGRKGWKKHFSHEHLEHLDDRISIEIPVEDLEQELELQLENFEEALEKEMHRLDEALQNIEVDLLPDIEEPFMSIH